MKVNTIKRIVPHRWHPYLGALRRWLRSLPPRPRWQKWRLLADRSLSGSERELLKKASGKIYFNDTMYDGRGAHYFKVGLSAMHCIEEAMAQAKLTDPPTILDFPCGSGRVLRFLAPRFPKAQLAACDLQSEAVRFCARTFGAEASYSSATLDELELGKKFDLIWCGSLATHFNEPDILALLRLFARHLRTGGLLIVTTHGDFVAQRLPRREFDYGLADEQVERIVQDYSRNGFAFTEYVGEQNWGVSLTSPAWLRARVRELGCWREVYFKERGWDRHQDVFGLVKQ